MEGEEGWDGLEGRRRVDVISRASEPAGSVLISLARSIQGQYLFGGRVRQRLSGTRAVRGSLGQRRIGGWVGSGE